MTSTPWSDSTCSSPSGSLRLWPHHCELGVADGRHLAVSIETRKEEGEAYSAFLGFFRQISSITWSAMSAT